MTRTVTAMLSGWGFLGRIAVVTIASMSMLVFLQLLGGEEGKTMKAARDSAHAAHYRPATDGLRAFSVLAVLAFHIEQSWLPGGYLGVDIFFVISGFVVTQSLFHNADCGLTTYYKFYARRAKRLMPACLLMVSLTALYSSAIIPPWGGAAGRRSRLFTSGQFARIGMSNNYQAHLIIANNSDDNYWNNVKGMKDDPFANPFTHTWSLGVEEQFYLIFPFILTLAYGRSLPSEEDRCRSRLMGVLVLSALTVASMGAACWISADISFYLLPARFWQLALGAVLYLTPSHFSALHVEDCWKPVMSYVLQMMALLSISYSVLMQHHEHSFSRCLIASCGAVFFIGAGCLQNRSHLNAFFSHSLLVYIGNISYPLYLFHWPVIALCEWLFAVTSINHKVGCVVVSFALSMFAYHCVEGPVRKRHPSRTWMILATSMSGILLVECWLLLLSGHFGSSLWATPEFPAQPHPLSVDSPHEFLIAGSSRNSKMCTCRLADRSWYKPPSAKSGLEAEGLPPCYVESPYDIQVARGVLGTDLLPVVPYDDSEDFRKTPKPTVYVVGDSHGAHGAAALYYAVRDNFIVEDLSLSSCFFGSWDCGGPDCTPSQLQRCQDRKRRARAKIAAELKPGDVVAVVNSAWTAGSSPRDQKYLEDLHDIVAARNGTTILFGYTPMLQYPGGSCMPSFYKQNAYQSCHTQRDHAMINPGMVKRVKGAQDMYRKLAETKSGIYFFDDKGLFCDDRDCGPFIPGTKTLAYYDNSHLTLAGSRYLGQYLCDFMAGHNLFPNESGH